MNTLTLINHNVHETTDSQNFQNFHNLWIQGFMDPGIYGFKVHEIYRKKCKTSRSLVWGQLMKL